MSERKSLWDAREKATLGRLLDDQQERLEAEWEASHHVECQACSQMQRRYTSEAIDEVIALRKKVEAL